MDEIEACKHIDLRAYFTSEGYLLDRKESWAGSAVMRHPDGDKVIIKRDAADGHYLFFSVRDEASGTIIDYLEKRRGLNWGAIFKELRPWIGRPAGELPPYPALVVTRKDRIRVETEFAKMHDASRHPYLENERGIPAELLTRERFAGRIRTDARGNAVFPHFDAAGALTGFEKKNTGGFTGFSSGGTKGLWLSHALENDRRLVFCESAIDALSYAVLFPDESSRYASVGGKLNPTQPELIRAAIARMPADAEIVAAMDADQAGRDLAEVVRRAAELSGRSDLRFRIDEPVGGSKDWNEILLARPKPPLPHRHEEPSVA